MNVNINVSGAIMAQVLARVAEINAKREEITEIDGYKITAEQCAGINAGERWAVDKFFEENGKRLKRLAVYFLRREGFCSRWDSSRGAYAPAIVEVEDCLNQLYIDMRRGYLVFALVPKMISRLICHSFQYAGVGGFGEEDGIFYCEVK